MQDGVTGKGETMSMLDRLRLWWWRRGLHADCIEEQAVLWHGGIAAMGACTRCLPRMERIRTFFTPVARSLP